MTYVLYLIVLPQPHTQNAPPSIAMPQEAETVYFHFRQGNEEFANGDIARAQILYSSAISMFPTPDAMNNMAACSLKQNQ